MNRSKLLLILKFIGMVLVIFFACAAIAFAIIWWWLNSLSCVDCGSAVVMAVIFYSYIGFGISAIVTFYISLFMAYHWFGRKDAVGQNECEAKGLES